MIDGQPSPSPSPSPSSAVGGSKSKRVNIKRIIMQRGVKKVSSKAIDALTVDNMIGTQPSPSTSPSSFAGVSKSKGMHKSSNGTTSKKKNRSMSSPKRIFKSRRGKGGKTTEGPYLPPSLMGEISLFLDVGDVGNLTIAMGRETAEWIRRAYLWRNYSYLRYSWDLHYEDRLVNFRAWMDANNDWRDLYCDQKEGEENLRWVFTSAFDSILRATELGLVEVVQHLIEERGADVNQEEAYDVVQGSIVRPLMVAYKLPDAAMLTFLLQQSELDMNYVALPQHSLNLRFLHQALSLRHTSRAHHLRLVLEHDGLDVNARMENGMTPLHLFLGRKMLPSDTAKRVKHLLEAGADLTARDNSGNTPLRAFIERSGEALDTSAQDEIIQLLHTRS